MRKTFFFIFLGLWLASYTNGLAQKVPTNKWFFIQSAQEYGESNKGYWDVPGYPTSIGAGEAQNIQVYKKEVKPDRQFSFMSRGGNLYDIAVGHAANSHLVKWERSFEKNGVNVQIESKNGDGSNELFNRQLFTLKYLGAGRWKIYSDDGRIMCLAGRSSKNSSNVHLWEDHGGAFTEWVFIDAHTGETIYPEFTPSLSHIKVNPKVQNPEILKTIANIDATYEAIYSAEKTVFKQTLETLEARKTVERSARSVVDCDDVYNQMYTLTLAIKPITFIPVVGQFMKPLHIGLEHTTSVLETTNEKVSELGDEVITPLQNSFNQSKKAVLGNESALADALSILTRMKRVYVEGARAISFADEAQINQFTSYTASINQQLQKMRSSANGIGSEFGTITELNTAIAGHKDKVNKVYNGLRKLSGSVDEVKDASREVKKIMSKKIGVSGFSTSLEELLDGEIPIPDIAKNKIEELKGKALSKIKDKLGIKIPSVPGVEEFQEAMEDLRAKTELTGESNSRLMMHITEMKNATNGLRTPFLNSIASIPYEKMKSMGLTELTVK